MRTDRHRSYHAHQGCALERAIEVIGGKWKPIILFHLLSGTQRFTDLRRALGGVTQRSLTKQLRELEQDGIVTRTVHAVVPPRVDYALTHKGRALGPALLALRGWSLSYLPQGSDVTDAKMRVRSGT